MDLYKVFISCPFHVYHIDLNKRPSVCVTVGTFRGLSLCAFQTGPHIYVNTIHIVRTQTTLNIVLPAKSTSPLFICVVCLLNNTALSQMSDEFNICHTVMFKHLVRLFHFISSVCSLSKLPASFIYTACARSPLFRLLAPDCPPRLGSLCVASVDKCTLYSNPKPCTSDMSIQNITYVLL